MPQLKIATDFRLSANIAKDSEVELFRKLAKSIVRNSSSVFVEETHGASRNNVSFTLTTGKCTRCEIADLLIVTRSKFVPFLRATFWQAKKQKCPTWVSLGSTDQHIDFKGQFNQWDLLSRRPTVSGVAQFYPPPDLLSSFDSASIGSFGVFYERAAVIEVMHSIAEFVTCGSPKAKHPTLVANAFLEKYSYMYGEAAVRPTLELFLQALFGHQIGAPLVPGEPAHQWLAVYAKSKVVASGQDLPTDFFFGYETQRTLDESPSGDGISVLLVDAD